MPPYAPPGYRVTSITIPLELEREIEENKELILAAQERAGLPSRRSAGLSRSLHVLARVGLATLRGAPQAPQEPPAPTGSRKLVRPECPYDDPPEGTRDYILLQALMAGVDQCSEPPPEGYEELGDAAPTLCGDAELDRILASI